MVAFFPDYFCNFMSLIRKAKRKQNNAFADCTFLRENAPKTTVGYIYVLLFFFVLFLSSYL